MDKLYHTFMYFGIIFLVLSIGYLGGFIFVASATAENSKIYDYVEFTIVDDKIIDKNSEEKLEIKSSDEIVENTNQNITEYVEQQSNYVPAEYSYTPEVNYANSYNSQQPSGNSYNNPFYSMGTTSDENYTYTWYSQNVLPGSGLVELNNNGRHVGDNGFIYDGDGYIAISSDNHEQGEIVATPWGDGKVYDTGSGSGNIDIYTDF